MADPHTLLYDGNKFHLVMKLSTMALCGIGREKLVKLPPRQKSPETQGTFPHAGNVTPEPKYIEWTVTCTSCAKGAQQIWQGTIGANEKASGDST